MAGEGGVFWTKFEHFLTKIRMPNFERSAPPPLASLAVQQKSFLHIFYFAPARFFLLKGKENFFADLCSERAGRRGFASARARRNSPHTPLPPRPRLGGLFFGGFGVRILQSKMRRLFLWRQSFLCFLWFDWISRITGIITLVVTISRFRILIQRFLLSNMFCRFFVFAHKIILAIDIKIVDNATRANETLVRFAFVYSKSFAS